LGGINIDGCRIPTDGEVPKPNGRIRSKRGKFESVNDDGYDLVEPPEPNKLGRWPANLIHDGSDEVLELFPETSPSTTTPRNRTANKFSGAIYNNAKEGHYRVDDTRGGHGDSGSAARFFYSAKTSKSERNLGCKDIYWERTTDGHILITEDEYNNLDNKDRAQGNIHPTVKPISLMQYLIRLITPPDGIVLDPFSGSGTTMLAAYKEGLGCLALEQDSTSNIIATARWETRK